MSKRTSVTARGAALAAVLSVVTASAFAAPKSETVVNRRQSETSVATVKAVDVATRHLTITTAKGETSTVKVPDSYKRLADLRPGDRIKATYSAEIEVALAAPGAKLPEDTAGVVGSRTVSGGPPGAGMASHITVSGAVLAIDLAKHIVKVVSPKGGEVHTITVDSPEGRRALPKLKVGDKITVTVSESLLLDVEPA